MHSPLSDPNPGEPEPYESPAEVAGDLNVSLLGALDPLEPELVAPFVLSELVDPGSGYDAIVDRIELLSGQMPVRLLGCLGLPGDSVHYRLTANLAARLARGRRVTIVEAEFGQSMLATDPRPRDGLIDMLLYGCSFPAVARPSGVPGVQVVTAGSHPWSGEPIHGDEWERVLGAFRSHSDLTLLAGTTAIPAPVLGMMSRRLDWILIAYALGRGSRHAIRCSYLTLWDMDAPILGLVVETARSMAETDRASVEILHQPGEAPVSDEAARAGLGWPLTVLEPAEQEPVGASRQPDLDTGPLDLDGEAEVVIREARELEDEGPALWEEEIARLEPATSTVGGAPEGSFAEHAAEALPGEHVAAETSSGEHMAAETSVGEHLAAEAGKEASRAEETSPELDVSAPVGPREESSEDAFDAAWEKAIEGAASPAAASADEAAFLSPAPEIPLPEPETWAHAPAGEAVTIREQDREKPHDEEQHEKEEKWPEEKRPEEKWPEEKLPEPAVLPDWPAAIGPPARVVSGGEQVGGAIEELEKELIGSAAKATKTSPITTAKPTRTTTKVQTKEPNKEPNRTPWRVLVPGVLVGVFALLFWAYQNEVIRFEPRPPRVPSGTATSPAPESGPPSGTSSPSEPAQTPPPQGAETPPAAGTVSPPSKEQPQVTPAPQPPGPAAQPATPQEQVPSPQPPAGAAPATAEAQLTGYGVHVSSFKTLAKANEDLARYQALGYRGVIVTVDIPGKGKWRRVMVGPYPTLKEAEAVAAAIRADRWSEDAQALRLGP